MCSALTMGQTQNANESLLSIIWHHSPKTKYVGQKSIVASTDIAFSTFNEGDLFIASVLKEMSISCSHSTLLHFTRTDQARNQNRERAILERHKRRRSQLTARATTAESFRKRRSNKGSQSTYISGKFGSEVFSPEDSGGESDSICGICQLHLCPGRGSKVDHWVGCDICETWYHCKCVGVNPKTLGDGAYFCGESG